MVCQPALTNTSLPSNSWVCCQAPLGEIAGNCRVDPPSRRYPLEFLFPARKYAPRSFPAFFMAAAGQEMYPMGSSLSLTRFVKGPQIRSGELPEE